MITLITGMPGAGKTAALVDLLRTHLQGRALYVHNLNGLTLEHFELSDPHAWMTEVPDGAAVVMDEVQRVWRPAGAGSKVPPHIEALETHRHRGIDFFLTTQQPGLLHSNVRKLVGRHIHIRDVGLLGRWWYEWPEATNVEQFRNAPVKKRYTLPKKAFGLYKSASMHVKPIRSIPRSVLVVALAGLACVAMAVRSYGSVSQHIAGAQAPSAPALANAASAPALPPPRLSAVEQIAIAADAAASAARGSVVGCMHMAERCTCFDNKGFPVIVEWEMCKVSARSYAGVVPLALRSEPAAKPSPAPSAPLGA